MTDQVEDKAEYKGDAVRQWLDALELAGKRQKEWEAKGQKIIDRYRDARSESDDAKRFNILWSNIETLRPAIYAKSPKPVVSRRYQDKDPIGRAASQVLERCLEYTIDSYDFDAVMKAVTEDYLLPGRGMSRVFFKPTYGEPQSIVTDQGEEQYTPVVYEEALCKYHFWKDVRLGEARNWEDLPWIAYRNFMTRKELTERFGDVGQKAPLNYKPEDCEGEQFKKAVVWEIWSKADGKVYWLAEGLDELLEESDPPLNLHGFFPSPKALFSLITNDNMIPVPDYCQYQDQADELDRLTGRIDKLLDALKVAGVYAGEHKDTLSQLLSGEENMMIPVDDWAMFAERGGVSGAISWYPVDQVAKVLEWLYRAREQTKQELYEITGLSDILRGASDSKETATAQRLKGQFATLRLQDRQKAVQEYARDLIRLKAEIICEHFSVNTLQMMTGLQFPPEVWAQIETLLKDDPLRSFRIEIETDSTIQPDEQAEKESRIEFLTASTDFIGKAAEIGQINPQLMPLFGEMLMFAVRGFRTGRELEDAFEQAMSNMSQPQPDPQQQQAQQIAQQKEIKEIEKTASETEKNQAETQQTLAETQKTVAEAEGQVIQNQYPGM